jgi:hypothetical protein
MTSLGITATLAAAALVSGCSKTVTDRSAPAPATMPPRTVTVVPPQVTVVVTSAGPPITVTVTREPATITLTPASPIDVTAAYVAWRKGHFAAEDDGESASQYQRVVRAVLAGGELNVLTTMSRAWGGWNCDGEPTTLNGERVAFVRILNQDSTVFRLCQVR